MALSRRAFIYRGSAAGTGIIIGLRLPGSLLAQENERTKEFPSNPFEAFVHIKPSGEIMLIVAKSEMGQGVRTGLLIPLAEELEVDLNSVTVQQAETRPDIYHHLGTGGSHSTRQNYMPLRRAGATVRELMISAAADEWNVPRNQCYAKEGAVLHRGTSRRASYGELVEAAAKLPLPDPEKVQLKKESEFRLIGHRVARVDVPAKVNGSAQFGLDVRVPGMLFAVIARCPTFGGKVTHFDASKAKIMPGIVDVFEIPAQGQGVFTAGGVVVVANSTWTAIQARRALEITWERGSAVSESSDKLRQSLRSAAMNGGKRVRNEGDVDAALSNGGGKLIEAVYEFPFQAHATMEPMNITIHARGNECEVWAPTQSPDWVQRAVAQVLGLPPQKVIVHTTFLGGGFGRRYMADYPTEAAQIAKKIDKPVQLVWTREDDMAHDFYRQASCHRFRGAVDAHGRPTAWSHTLASTSIYAMWHPDQGPEELEVGGAKQMPYAIPNVRLEYAAVETAVPRAWWRSVEHSFNGFAVECFIDELAHAANRDPVEFRRSLLLKATKPLVDEDDVDPLRLRKVLDVAVEKSGWGKPLPKGWGRGIASYASFGSYFAEVAEVSVSKDKQLEIHRIVAAVDCGTAVNPEGIREQTEGAIIFGLSAALKTQITINNGAVEQSNFTDFDPIRINEAPPIEVYLAPSGDAAGGMGEPALPPLAPAVANAIFAATGQRLRSLPFQLTGVT